MHIRRTGLFVALAGLLIAGAARAQNWQEHAYPEAGFSVQFPAEPAVTETRYRAPGLEAPAKVYAAKLGSGDYSVTVADLSSSPLAQDAAIDTAVKALAATGEVKVDVRARIDRQFGREVSLKGRDGGQITTAVFYIDKKLYVLAGRTEPDASALASRFQQSLQFIGADGRPPRRPEDGPGFGGRGFGRPGFGPGEVAQGPDGQGPGGQGFRRRRPPPEAFADCQGKTEGAAVQHQTPRGDVVAATCVSTPEGLAARPNRPLGPPPDGPPPEG
jgi:hypothetical protein